MKHFEDNYKIKWKCPYCNYEVEKERIQSLRLAQANHLRKHKINYQEYKRA